MLQVLKDFQPIIAAALALSGLVVGYLLNSALARRSAQWTRMQDARALAAMYLGEVQVLVRQTAMINDVLGQVEMMLSTREAATDLSVAGALSHSGHYFFERGIERIGLLGPELTIEITLFYHQYFDVIKGVDGLFEKEKKPPSIDMIQGIREGLTLVEQFGAPLIKNLYRITGAEPSAELYSRYLTELHSTESGPQTKGGTRSIPAQVPSDATPHPRI